MAARLAKVPLSADGRRLPRHLSRLISPIRTCRMRGPALALRRDLWDNHEFLLAGVAKHPAGRRTGRTPGTESIKVAANQACVRILCPRASLRRQDQLGCSSDRQPSRMCGSSNGIRTASASSPTIVAAINSPHRLSLLRYGRHLDLIITDQHSYLQCRSLRRPGCRQLLGPEFPGMFPEDAAQILDGGRSPSTAATRRTKFHSTARTLQEPADGPPPRNDPRRHPENLVQGPAAQIDRDLEDLGQFRRRPGLAQRPAEPSRAGLTKENAWPEDHLCFDE